MSGMRPVAAPFVAAAPTGARVRTRLRLSPQDEAVRLSKLRMPLPTSAPALVNPVADLAKTGVGPATKVLKVSDPAHEYDGTRCHVHFEPVADAKGYDMWVSTYPDGRGAMQLGAGWKESVFARP